MKKFVKELATNRFGIVMATLNICYFLSSKSVQSIFSHQHGETCFYYNNYFWVTFTRLDISGLVISADLPSFVLSALQGNTFVRAFPDLCSFTQMNIQIIFFAFFVTLQWLFIGWAARKIANKLSKSV